MASALLLPYLSPRTLVLSKNQPHSLPISSSSVSLTSVTRLRTPLLFSPSISKNAPIFSSSFSRNVAVSSEFDQDEVSGVEEEEVRFSQDLKLFVGNLPFSVDSSTLAGLFERAGNVEMVEVIYDKLTGKSRGFGFVTMSTVEEVEAAAQQFNGYELEGRSIRVNAGPPPPKDESRGFRGGGGDDSRGYRGGGGDDSRGYRGGGGDDSRGYRGGGSDDSRGYRGGGGGSNFGSSHRVHVGNLPWNVDESALESLFGEQGNVVEARVIYDRDSGRSRGFGFVSYNTAGEANSAISSLNGVELSGRSIKVTMAESRPRRQF
ncbi:31 kDa ribonucleoprotein, chloroplastic [Aristolochia californica]|uniref:31 kDa ribonucleoprotein, chloroplastic n=1 Tax=Aristolochia californica TaxID=171875 RepID=UPI0035D9839C